MKQSWYSRLKERSRAWLLPVHIILAVWFFLFVGNLEAGFPADKVLMPAYMIIMLGPVAFLVINIPLSIYSAVKLRKGQADGENRTILIVFAALNAFIGLVVWGFLIAFILIAKDIKSRKSANRSRQATLKRQNTLIRTVFKTLQTTANMFIQKDSFLMMIQASMKSPKRRYPTYRAILTTSADGWRPQIVWTNMTLSPTVSAGETMCASRPEKARRSMTPATSDTGSTMITPYFSMIPKATPCITFIRTYNTMPCMRSSKYLQLR